MTDYFIGLMSGTSMDGVDGVLLAIDCNGVNVVAHHSIALPSALKDQIHRLSHPGEDSIDLLGQCDYAVAHLFAETAQQLIANSTIAHSKISAIGSHGQTIRHRPHWPTPFTLQIGNPSIIAAETGITTVADFRRKDMALNGEGAPLVPAFHRQVFGHPQRNRAIINIGGIGNITWLPATDRQEAVLGFDSGPGNTLMDCWVQQHLQQDFDNNGEWAASAPPSQALLDVLRAEPYLQLAPPKSTGKELFNSAWLNKQLATLAPLAPAEVQASLCRFTAETLALGLTQLPTAGIDEIFVCGGGALNLELMSQFRSLVAADISVRSTAELGIDAMHVEGAAFAWLAHQTLNRLTGNLSSVTGASRDTILGGIYFP